MDWENNFRADWKCLLEGLEEGDPLAILTLTVSVNLSCIFLGIFLFFLFG